ncbi:MAG: HAD-IA family hydrolase [Acidimicrobiales bacterium]
MVTSGSRRLASARWAAAGVTVPDVTVTAESVTRGKPHPEPFLAAANALGVHPSRCLVFEDSASGAQAADAAGRKSPPSAAPHGQLKRASAFETSSTSASNRHLTERFASPFPPRAPDPKRSARAPLARRGSAVVSDRR